jgi:anaerobic ribonucleoside-triphosphate reductase
MGKGSAMVNLPRRARGVKVLKAVSSSLRLQILNLLFDKGALSYTELMNALKMNPSRDAGRFAYHLKFLLKADLLEPDSEAKKYNLTDLGKMVLDVAERVEKKAVKPRGMTIRTSHYTLEEFDPNKIANSLIKEAKMPPEIAQKAAKEAEKRLLKSKTKYLTTPLVREVVNAILVEKGFEEYRHKLTRLGMPVHEVAALMEAKNATDGSMHKLATAGEAVFGEYALLNVLPRDVADAHVSGAIHIESLGTWVLKPSEVSHDLRFFFQNGVNIANQLQLSTERPKSFESALSAVFSVLLHAGRELNGCQICAYFNVFLAPFVKGIETALTKEHLRLFILNLNQHVDSVLGLELSIPHFMEQKAAIGPEGKVCGTYKDFADESLLIASLVIELLREESLQKPLLNPKLILRITNQAFENESEKAVLISAHALAAGTGVPYFVNAKGEDVNSPVFSSSGLRFEADLTGDWETDTLRTGCLGTVTINLPRIVIESEKDKNKFFEILRERYEMSARALGIKFGAFRQHGKTLLPFLTQSFTGDPYLGLENCSRIINFAGFWECVRTFYEKEPTAEESTKLVQEIVQTIVSSKQKLGRKHGKRLYPALLPSSEASERLAKMDIENYGIARIKFSGTRERPFYSAVKRMHIQSADSLFIPSEEFEPIQKLRGVSVGGGLSIIDLGERDYKPEALFDLTKRIVQNQTLEFFTYNRIVTYCSNCKRSWLVLLHKCPSCGAISTLTVFDRFSNA